MKHAILGQNRQTQRQSSYRNQTGLKLDWLGYLQICEQVAPFMGARIEIFGTCRSASLRGHTPIVRKNMIQKILYTERYSFNSSSTLF